MPSSTYHSINEGSISYRSVWISDLHLGTRLTNSLPLIAFLQRLACERLFLVGDIVDFLHLGNGGHWEAAHTKVIKAILKLARRGTKVVYVPGNHDRSALAYPYSEIANVEVAENCVHWTADGKQLWVTHGDQFDFMCSNAPWLTDLGDALYRGAIRGNSLLASFNPLLNGEPLINAARQHTLTAVSTIKDFERRAAKSASLQGFDGIVCGHLHSPAQRLLYGISYWNSGDWVKHNSAVVEDYEGRLSLLYGDARLEETGSSSLPLNELSVAKA